MEAKITKWTLDNGKIMFPSALAREAWVLHMNIRDLNYVLKRNKKDINIVDKEIFEDVIKTMIKSHQRMLDVMTENGEFVGKKEDIKYE
jgi:membrane-bound acyltransferase YfiQ involved in biofilm formation